jgi:membrane associated rhomboid family serine protease
MTYTFLGLMWITFLFQFVARAVGGEGLHNFLFVLDPSHPEYVWTYVTHMFAHSPFGFAHIAGNSIIIFFFGRLVERHMGSKRFAAFFLASGIIAGTGQMLLAHAEVFFTAATKLGAGGLGASGAGLAILGYISVINPDLRVYLWFLLPIPVWVLTVFYFGTSLVGITGNTAPFVSGNVAHMAHLAGLVSGLVYGLRTKGEKQPPQQLQFGGGGGGRRRGPGGPGGPGGRF